MEQPPSTPSFVGIDVAKDRLDVHVRPAGETFAVPRDGKGLEALVAALQGRDVALVVLEATGGFELSVAAALAGARLPLAVVNPRQIRDFARATGRLAKTDALDAEAIARFAEAIRPEPRPLAGEDAQALSELVVRRRQLVEMIGMEKNRARQARARRVRSSPCWSTSRRANACGRSTLGCLHEFTTVTRLALPSWCGVISRVPKRHHDVSKRSTNRRLQHREKAGPLTQEDNDETDS